MSCAAQARGGARVVLLESGGWGGLAHYSYNLAEALAAIGHETTLLTQAPFELADMPRAFTLRTFERSASYANRWRAVRAVLAEVGAPVLHLQSTVSARRDWMHLWRITRGGTRLVVTAHNVLPHDRAEREAFGMRWAFGRIYGMSDTVIAHGEQTRRRLQDEFRIPSERIAVIPLGHFGFAATGATSADARAALGLADDALLLLAFGAIREYKGIPDLIDAFAEVAADFPTAQLLIVGKPIGVAPDVYREQIKRQGIDDRVILRPEYVPFEQIGRYFAACDVAVYPYRHIDQSGALQLAYGAGRPVVATEVGELSSTVRDGWNGLLVPSSEPAILARALRDVLSRSPEERAQMGVRSRQLAEEMHNWSDAAEQTARVYRAVTAG